MIWSLTKILGFVALAAVVAYFGGQLLDIESVIQITAFGYEVTLGPIQAVILSAILIGLIWLSLRVAGLSVAIFRFINGDETAISRYFDRNRERRGFEALADGMMALASGEGALAMAKASRAEKYLARPELTNLLAAQAAEMTGDKGKAEEVYKRLLVDDRTRFVGVRGILKQKLADGDTDTALALAEHAFALKPRHEETTDILMRLQAEAGDWTGARKTLGAKVRAGTLPRDVHRRRDAVLALAESDVAGEDRLAIEANRLSPDLGPAAVAAARALIADGKKRQAIKIIQKAWDSQPHPDLAAAFAEIEPDETPQERIKRFDALLRKNPDHSETRFVRAELALAAEEYQSARDAVSELEEDEPSSRTLALMAAIERGSGGDEALVRSYLTRAVNAPRGPAWVCENCGSVHGSWASICGNCKAVDTLSWRKPDVDPASVNAELVLLADPPVQAAEQSQEQLVDLAEDTASVETLDVVPPNVDFVDPNEGGEKPNH